MKILTFAAGIALALGSIASSVPAEAHRTGYSHNHGRGGYDRRDDRRRYNRGDRRWRNHHSSCRTVWRNHRRVQICR